MNRHALARYAAGGPLLSYAISGLVPEHEAASPGPGAWSLGQVVAHLLDADLVFSDRIKRVLAEDNPTLQPFAENAWVARLAPGPVAEAAELFAANRRWTLRLLGRATEADFARAGTHLEAGRLTLAAIVAKSVGHLDHHLRFLYGKRANLGLAIAPQYAPLDSTTR